MRSVRFSLMLCLLLSYLPAWGQQQSTQAAAQPTNDPQAVAVVQAAITALGGATVISQAQNWAFKAQTQGPHSNGNVDYSLSTDPDTGKITKAGGSTTPAPLISSHFVPALVGAILLKESQDPEFTIQYGGSGNLESKPVTAIVFMVGKTPMPAQIWVFDAANLPVLIDFRSPAEIGARQSFPVVVGLSDYRLVSGIMYPFQISTFLPGKPPEIITVQSVTAGLTAITNDYNASAGDLR